MYHIVTVCQVYYRLISCNKPITLIPKEDNLQPVPINIQASTEIIGKTVTEHMPKPTKIESWTQ